MWAQSLVYVQLCDPTGCSPPGSSVPGIIPPKILKWVAIASSWGSSWPRDRTNVSCIGRWFLYHWDSTFKSIEPKKFVIWSERNWVWAQVSTTQQCDLEHNKQILKDIFVKMKMMLLTSNNCFEVSMLLCIINRKNVIQGCWHRQSGGNRGNNSLELRHKTEEHFCYIVY